LASGQLESILAQPECREAIRALATPPYLRQPQHAGLHIPIL
jgi:hypothetical protein